jgi:NAD(P)-dependent dehydrogenase (short-subunit alcohol dehydrogenase family)
MLSPNNEWNGRTVIVTGAGAGVGRALVQGFFGQGAHVVAISRGAAKLQETRGACSGPGSIEIHALDVTDAQALEALFSDVVARRKSVDVLVNCAAVYPRKRLNDTPAADWSADMATNVNGVVFGCRAALRTFPADRASLVFNVGSFAYLGPEPASTLYCASKAAVSAFTRAFAVELADGGSSLGVHEWLPGMYRTQMSQFTGEDPALAFPRLLAVVALARQGPGGRRFVGGEELIPARSLKSRIKRLLLGRKD